MSICNCRSVIKCLPGPLRDGFTRPKTAVSTESWRQYLLSGSYLALLRREVAGLGFDLRLTISAATMRLVPDLSRRAASLHEPA